MILNRSFYAKISFLKNLWNSQKMRKLVGKNVFKAFQLHRVQFPDNMYFYSTRLKRIPRFSGNRELLANWSDSKSCEMICPTKAITVTLDAFVIDPRGCIACGLCLEVAPEGLLEVVWVPSDLVR
jgi:NAD-dependent dihydropyrimidine dehydrogenase PreA subunit